MLAASSLLGMVTIAAIALSVRHSNVKRGAHAKEKGDEYRAGRKGADVGHLESEGRAPESMSRS